MKPKAKTARETGYCEFCSTDNVGVHPVEQTGESREPANMCGVCYELGAYYVKDAMKPLRFDQFSRGLRMVLKCLPPPRRRKAALKRAGEVKK